MLADSGYDSNAIGDAVERDQNGRSSGHRFLCPPNRRNIPGRPRSTHLPLADRQAQHRRWKRIDFYNSPRGQRLYSQRSKSVEPLHERLKALFDLNPRVWHRGLGNNKTLLLSVIFCYQLLVRFNHRRGHRNAQVQWIMESV